MPLYYTKKTTQTETREELSTASNTFLLTRRSSDWSVMLYIGGLTTYCIECQVQYDSPTANLVKIDYNETCSLSVRFKRGEDTVRILELLLSYIQNTFKHVRQLQFDDYSSRECDERRRIDLAPFYYVFNEKTWYMNTMGAKFADKEDADTFLQATKEFQKKKPTTTWMEYDRYVTTAHPLPEEEMKTLFEEHTTWTSFFNALKSRVDIAELCKYMEPWIQRFVKEKSGLQFSTMRFVMDVPNPTLRTVLYTSKPYVKNGGRFTVKQRKFGRSVDLR